MYSLKPWRQKYFSTSMLKLESKQNRAYAKYAKQCTVYINKPGLAKPSLAQPGLAKPSLAKPSQAQPSLAKPSLAKPSQAYPETSQLVRVPTRTHANVYELARIRVDLYSPYPTPQLPPPYPPLSYPVLLVLLPAPPPYPFPILPYPLPTHTFLNQGTRTRISRKKEGSLFLPPIKHITTHQSLTWHWHCHQHQYCHEVKRLMLHSINNKHKTVIVVVLILIFISHIFSTNKLSQSLPAVRPQLASCSPGRPRRHAGLRL